MKKTTTNDGAAERRLNAVLGKCLPNFQPPEDLTVDEWADKYRILSAEASAEAGRWRTSRTPYLREIMGCFTDPRVNRISMVSASQIGKALALDTPLPTPTGWTTMGEVQPGDVLFDEHGKQCVVQGKSPVMYDHDCYRVTFSDGAVITADADHVWTVDRLNNHLDEERLDTTTREIAADYKLGKRNRYAIPVAGALDCDSGEELPVPPYTLGYWLGDGNSYSAQLTVAKNDSEVIDYIKGEGIFCEVVDQVPGKQNILLVKVEPKDHLRDENICLRGHDMRVLGRTKQGYCAECQRQHSKKSQYGFVIDPVIPAPDCGTTRLRKLGLIGNKHIPQQYLRASYEARLALLQGLMDSDGTINKYGRCEITLKSIDLINDLSELLHTLGIKHTVNYKKSVCTNAVNGPKATDTWRISFLVYETKVFRLKRKLDRIKHYGDAGKNGKPLRTTETLRRRIVDVQKVESVLVQCIAVDSPSHLYLAGWSMVPTHNSEAILNMIAYCIDQDPGSILFVQPTIDDAKKFSRLRVAPMIRDCPKLRKKVAEVKARASGNTMLQKEFPGGMLTITGANSPSALASTPARYIFGDERDRWPRSAGSEGDPWKLAEARQATFYNRKAVEVSTPTVKGRSNIEEAFRLGTQERWLTKCPECGEYSEINWSRIKFEYDSVTVNHKRQYTVKEPIYWVCEKCGCLVEEAQARKQECKWVASNPAAYEKGHRSFWLNAFVSPWTPWKKIVLEFLEAHEDPARLQVVFNTLLGLLWEQRGDLADEEQLLARREDYGKTAEGLPVEIPDGVLVLAAGWDTQDNRLEYEVVGYGHNNETWGIRKGFIMGEPTEDEVWRQFDDITDHVYRFKDGRGLKISISMVDSGGHYTDEVYKRCRQRKFKRVFAVKGQGGEGVPYVRPPSKVPVDPKEDKRTARVFTWLYNIGVDAGKAALMTSLRVETPGPNYCHFPLEESKGYGEDYFSGLLSERLELEETKTGRRWAWVKMTSHARNEALDCRNYANAGIRILQPDMFAVEKRLLETAAMAGGDAIQEEPQQKKRAQVPRKKKKSPVDKYFEEW